MHPKSRFTKIVSTITSLVLIASSLSAVTPVIAQDAPNYTLSAVSVTPGSVELDVSTAYTIAFTPTINILGAQTAPNGSIMPRGTIYLGFSSRSGNIEEGYVISLSSASLGSGSSFSGTIGTPDGGGGNDQGINIFPASTLSAGSTVTIVLTGVVNPPAGKAGAYTLFVNANAGTGADTGDFGESEVFYLGFGAMNKTVSGTVTFADGTPVTDAQVNANKKGGGGEGLFINTNTNASGAYSMNLPGGEWELMINPQWDQTTNRQKTVNWAYLQSGPPPTASFTGDDTSESAVVNFSVVQATATVTGKVVYPDGSPATNGGVDVRSSSGQGAGTGFDESGVFTARVPAGTYTVGGFIEDGNYSMPSMAAFTVGENQTENLGTITLVKKNEHIKGAVTDKDTAVGVAGVTINAWQGREGSGWAQVTTDSSGNYDLLVTPGSWEVMPEPDPATLDYTFVQSGPPTRIKISADQTITGVNFQLTKTDGTITGTVVDASGTQLTNFFGFAMAMGGSDEMGGPGPGTEVRGGAFTLKVPAGTWTVNVDTPPESNYSSTGGQTVTVATGETKTVSLTVKPNDAYITGSVKDENGNTIAGVHMEVFADAPGGGFKHTFVDQSTGTYAMGVLGGTAWYMGVFVEPGSGYMMQPPDENKVTISAGSTVTRDFTLLTADASISGTVLDPNGVPLSNVFAFADSNAGLDEGGKNSDFKGFGIHTGDMVKSDGTFTLALPAGTYGVGSGAPSSLGYISPDLQKVTVASGQSVTGITLQYQASDAAITGSVYLNGTKNQAFIWAWSEDGGFSETMTFSGDYTLNITSGEIWHIGADYESGSDFYQSSEHIIAPIASGGSVTQNLTMVKSSFDMPNPVSKTFNAAYPATITLDNGMQLSIPAGALATSGNVTVTVTPTAQLAKQRTSRPVAFGYDIAAYNSSGSAITSSFNSDVTITIPYTDAMLAALGITEDDLAAAYFSGDSNLWSNVTSAIVDKDNNQVVITVDHFTSFALVTGSADTTPPANPTGLIATAGAGKVTLNWTSPTNTDFDHLKIYRSTVLSTRGDLLHTTTSNPGTVYEDTSVTADTTYYYTLTAVDTTGNESTGTSQVSATPSASEILPVTGISLGQALNFYLTQLLLVLGLLVALFTPRYLLLRKLA